METVRLTMAQALVRFLENQWLEVDGAQHRFVKGLFINKKAENEITQTFIDRLNTKTPGTDQLVVNLSGGNQQKVVLAKWLSTDAKVILLHEPTRGIDIGAKQLVLDTLVKLNKERGLTIVMVSSELPELLSVTDKIVVMCEGEMTGTLNRTEATQELIMELASPKAD